MSEEKNKTLNDMLISTAAGAAVLYFAWNNRPEKIAEEAKALLTKAIDDYKSEAKEKNISNAPANKALPASKFKGYPKNKIKNANKNN